MQNQKLPTKTRIAAWIFIIESGIIGSFSLWATYDCLTYESGGWGGLVLLLFVFPIFFFGLLCLILGLFLLKKKRSVWKILIGLTLIICFGSIFLVYNSGEGERNFLFYIPFYISISLFFVHLFIFIFLLLDRKNFFKVAE